MPMLNRKRRDRGVLGRPSRAGRLLLVPALTLAATPMIMVMVASPAQACPTASP
jgi:hypothetical protein